MDSTTDKDKNLPPQGNIGSPRGRRELPAVVSGRSPSTSSNGQEMESTAGSTSQLATAEDLTRSNDQMEIDPPLEEAEIDPGLATTTQQPNPDELTRTENILEEKGKAPDENRYSTSDRTSETLPSTGERDTGGSDTEWTPGPIIEVMSSTDSAISETPKTVRRRQIKRLPEGSPSSEDIPLNERIRYTAGGNKSDKSDTSSDTAINEEDANLSERDDEWNSASSSLKSQKTSIWLRSQGSKETKDPEKSSRKRRKIEESEKKKKEIEKRKDLTASTQIKSSQEDKIELINRAGNRLDTGLEELGNPSYDLMSGCDLGAYAMDVLEELQKSRLTSQAFTKGTLQGALKKGYQKIEDIIKTFVSKTEAKGDAVYYKRKLDICHSEMRRMKEENAYLKQEIEQLKKDFLDLRENVRASQNNERQNVLPASSSVERIEITPDINYLVQRQEPRRRRNSREFPTLPPKEFPSLRTRTPVRGGPVPPPRKSKIEHEAERINKQITALKTARARILSGSEETNKNTRRKEQDNMRELNEEIRGKTPPPPRDPPSVHQPQRLEEEDWTRVTSGRKKRNKQQSARPTTQEERSRKNDLPMYGPAKTMPRKRPPRTSAISIKVQEGMTYAEALRKIRQEMTLSEIGIDNIRIRRAANQSTLLEVSGADNASKADALAGKVREILGDKARISRPVKRADMRILGFDESVTPEEIECAIAENGNCRIEEVKVGRISFLRNGLCMVIANCPLGTAIEVTNRGKIRIGWTAAKTTLLKPRPLQCFRCWYYGHASYNCRKDVNRQNACFNCCSREHKVQDCRMNSRCIICEEQNYPCNHRMGSSGCKTKLLEYSSNADRRPAK